MKFYRLSLLFIPFAVYAANLFVITDKKGVIVQEKILEHSENEYLNQDAREFSLQAMYDQLHREENLARAAQAAKEAAERIAQADTAAKKEGTTYQLTTADREALLRYARYFKGGKYVWGGTTPEGFDCSGYVQYLYKKQGIDLPRTAWSQSKKGRTVTLDELQKGDLLFFLTDRKRGIPVTHVGIYVGNGEFIHAASRKQGIIISPITHGKYRNCFVSARRIIPQNG
ncbi:C40 family peptidase [Sulfurovum sp. ST-21]|uniref:C40 family peptidase n=1 Tax=Sulfurovum indicum TaxID=2779528 RepID=A0A7M1S2M4_9BACT|nr:C40 family peptidase [Sulfurovum indicum]QOR61312.1 C40 family peptidase [Sulfurovum indicum]